MRYGLLRLVLVFGLLLGAPLCFAQQDASAFLGQFREFVDSIEAKQDRLSINDVTACDVQYKKFNEQYQNLYQEQMNDGQIEDFNEYRVKYTKAIAHIHANNISNKVDSVTNDVEKNISKKQSEISGYIKGIFGSGKKSGK